MKSSTITGIVLLLAIMIIMVLSNLIIYQYTQKCPVCPSTDTCSKSECSYLFSQSTPYYGSDYPYYNTSSGCMSFANSDNWIEFDLVNLSDNSVVFWIENASKNASCSDNTAISPFNNWEIPPDKITYISTCSYATPGRFLSLFVGMNLQVTDSSWADNIPISYMNKPASNQVTLENVNPITQKLRISIMTGQVNIDVVDK